MKAWITSILITIGKDIAYDLANWIIKYFKQKKEARDRLKEDEEVIQDSVKAGSDPSLTDEQRIKEQIDAHKNYTDHFKP